MTENKLENQKMSEELEEEKFDLASFTSAEDFVKKAILSSKSTCADDIAKEVEANLTEDGKQRLLTTLIKDKVMKFDKKAGDTKDMNELVLDRKPGQYPYKNGYNKDLYKKQLYQLQIELLKLQSWIKDKGKKLVVIFEGRDAAGKGGTIQRFMQYLNPRQARIAALPKPSETEDGQWYFQRYVAKLPTAGEMVFFDRSWYNRAVVEPVMGFCTQKQYDTFMKEVPSFEKNLVNSDIVLIKFWLDVSRQEQKRRFKQRRKDPLKRWKLSPVDLASLDKWDQYTQAINAMFFATDTIEAPWTIIRSDDKLRARLNAIRAVLLSFPYEGRDLDVIGELDPLIIFRANSVNAQVDSVEAAKLIKKKKH